MWRRKVSAKTPPTEDVPADKPSYLRPWATFGWTRADGTVRHFIRGERVRADDPIVPEVKAGGGAGFYPES